MIERCGTCGQRVERKCNRCGKKIPGGWENDMTCGTIKLQRGGQIFKELNPHTDNICGDDSDFHFWGKILGGHPIVQQNDAQDVVLSWGYDKQWRLCMKCNDALIGMVGKFFFDSLAHTDMRSEDE